MRHGAAASEPERYLVQLFGNPLDLQRRLADDELLQPAEGSDDLIRLRKSGAPAALSGVGMQFQEHVKVFVRRVNRPIGDLHVKFLHRTERCLYFTASIPPLAEKPARWRVQAAPEKGRTLRDACRSGFRARRKCRPEPCLSPSGRRRPLLL